MDQKLIKLEIDRIYKQDGVPFEPKRYRSSNKDVNLVWAGNTFRTKVKRELTSFDHQ